jgi:hypothetical protein
MLNLLTNSPIPYNLQSSVPAAFDNSLTFSEMIGKMTKNVNDCIDSQNTEIIRFNEIDANETGRETAETTRGINETARNSAETIRNSNETNRALAENDRRLIQINVKDYGAKGDGTTDDTAAFQSAVNEAAGKILFIPSGTYKISVPVIATGINYTRICGFNATLIFNYDTGDNSIKPCLKFVNCTGIEVTGLIIKSGDSDANSTLISEWTANIFAIITESCSLFDIHHNTISLFTDGMHINNSRNITVHDNVIFNCAQEHTVFENSVNCKFTHNEGYWNCGDGVIVKHYSIAEPSCFTFSENYFHDGKIIDLTQFGGSGVNCGGGFTVNNENTESTLNYSEYIVARNNRFVNTAYGVLLGNCIKAFVSGNFLKTKIKDTGYYTYAGYGLDNSSINNPATIDYWDIKFIGNTVDGSNNGFFVNEVSSGDVTISYENIKILSNTIINCSKGIFAYKCLIENNYIKSCFNFMRLYNCNANHNVCKTSLINSSLTADQNTYYLILLQGDCIFSKNEIIADYGYILLTAAKGIYSGNKFSIGSMSGTYVSIISPNGVLKLDGNIYNGLNTYAPYIATDNGLVFIDGFNTLYKYQMNYRYKTFITNVTLSYVTAKSLSGTIDLTNIGFTETPKVFVTFIDVGQDDTNKENAFVSTNGETATTCNIRLLSSAGSFIAGDTATANVIIMGK